MLREKFATTSQRRMRGTTRRRGTANSCEPIEPLTAARNNTQKTMNAHTQSQCTSQIKCDQEQLIITAQTQWYPSTTAKGTEVQTTNPQRCPSPEQEHHLHNGLQTNMTNNTTHQNITMKITTVGQSTTSSQLPNNTWSPLYLMVVLNEVARDQLEEQTK